MTPSAIKFVMQSMTLFYPQIKKMFTISVNTAPNICMHAIKNGANLESNSSDLIIKFLKRKSPCLTSPSNYKCRRTAETNLVTNTGNVEIVN